MRIDYQETHRNKAGRPASGLDASSFWTMAGVALLAACAHDGSSFLESGGGETGAEAASSASFGAMLAAIAVVGFSASGGGGGAGGGEDRYSRAYTWQLDDTEEGDENPDDFSLRSQSQQEVPQRFLSDFPEGEDVSFSAMLPDGTVSQAVPRPQASPQASAQSSPQSSPQSQMEGMSQDSGGGGKVYNAQTFNYNRMLEGEYGTLYYNSGEGDWTYEADPDKVNPLKEGEKGEEVFHVSAVASSAGAASRPAPAPSRALSITINGKNERSEKGSATWSADAAKVGDVLTVTLTDNDGIPTEPGDRPRFEFFHDDDTDETNGYTVISPELASATREAHIGVVNVAQAHVGKHIGVKISYTDINGNDEEFTEYANKAAGVANHEFPGAAAFDPGRPAVGAAKSFTVRLSDGNMPASVKYQWFYADDTNANAPTNKVLIQADGAEPDPKTGADRYFDTLTDITPLAADKYLGVEITYNDGAGSGEDKIVAFATETIDGRGLSTAPQMSVARNYGPSISPDRNKADQFILALKSQHLGYQTQPKVIVFGERGWLNDPQHTPNSELLMTFENVVSTRLENRSADSAGLELASNHSNLIVDRGRSPDTHFDSIYGTWRFDRLDEHSARTETEEEGVLWWTYQLGATSAQHAAVQAYINGGGNYGPRYDQMFIRVTDGVDDAVVRLTVEVSKHFNPFYRNLETLKHIETPETGAAPTLTPSNEQTIQTAASVYYESTQTWGWDSLNNHFTWTREFNYGDYDTNQGDLRLVYHVRHVSSVEFATEFLTDRTFLDIPHDYLDATPELKATAIANGWEPGDVGFTGNNEIGTSANRDPNQHSAGWTYMEGRFGNFYAKRIDDHETRIAEGRDETGVLRWYYDLGGADDEYTIIGNRNSVDHPNHFTVKAIGSGYFGFDIVYFQMMDDDGNKSDVRSIVVPIAGADSTIEGAINRQYYPHRAWLDSYDNIYENNYDVPADYTPESSASAGADIL